MCFDCQSPVLKKNRTKFIYLRDIKITSDQLKGEENKIKKMCENFEQAQE